MAAPPFSLGEKVADVVGRMRDRFAREPSPQPSPVGEGERDQKKPSFFGL
jgi:hypothetical protein